MDHQKSEHKNHHYSRLFFMAILSFGSMFLLMYAMVDDLENVIPNINQAYMALLMSAPMVIIELFMMKAMFSNKRWNVAIAVTALFVLVGSYTAIRKQTAVADEQFLKSMIPHHAGAILMCEEASLKDAEVQALCKQIVASQEAEIKQMKRVLSRLP